MKRMKTFEDFVIEARSLAAEAHEALPHDEGWGHCSCETARRLRRLERASKELPLRERLSRTYRI